MRLIVLAAATAAVLVVAWFLVSPLFIDEEVNEDFPVAETAAPASGEAMEEAMAEAAARPDTEMDEPMMPGAPETVATGTFRDADAVHRGSGTATLYRLADGGLVLRLEDFRVTNGPDLRVWLSKADAPQGSSDVSAADYLDLGALKGNVGSQNYEIPEGTELGDYNAAVIWCRAFGVLFATADF